MRYVAFLFLLVLSLYFLFLKPLLVANRVIYDIEGVRLSLSPLSVEIRSLYIYFPLSDRYNFLSLKNLFVSYEGLLRLSLEEGSFISTGESSRKGRRSVPNILVPEIFREAEIRVGRFLFTLQGKRTVSVIVGGLVLSEGKLRGNAEVISESLRTYVYLEEARFVKDGVAVEDMRVLSELFELRLKGDFSEGKPRATFLLEGRINGIEREHFVLSPVIVEGKGSISYEGLEAELRGKADRVKVKGRLELKDLRGTAKVSVKFGEHMHVGGRVWNGPVSATYSLELARDALLKVGVESFPIDSELLGISPLLIAWVRGDLLLNFDTKDLNLYLATDSLLVENFSFGSAYVNLEYNLEKRDGRVELRVSEPGYLVLSGRLEEGRFTSFLRAEDIFLIKDRVSVFLSYEGELSYRGALSLKGEGRFEDLHYASFPVGSGYYRITLKDKDLSLSYKGEGFSGFVRGKLGESILSVSTIKGLKRNVSGAEIEILDGKVELSLLGDKIALALSITGGGFKRGGVAGTLSGRLKLFKSESLTGDYSLRLGNSELARRGLPELHLKGSIKGDKVNGTFEAGELLRGDLLLNLRDRLLKLRGTISKEGTTLVFAFRGTPQEGRLSSVLNAEVLANTLLVRGEAFYKGDKFSLSIEPVRFNQGMFTIDFEGLKVEGDREEAKVELAGIKVSLLGETLVELSQEAGVLSLRERRFEWKGGLSGAITGTLDVGYREDFYARSKGKVLLDNLSFFMATPLGGKARGELVYSLRYSRGQVDIEVRNGGKVITYSRFFSFPMEAWVDLRALGRSLAAFIAVWKGDAGLSANVGSLNLKDYYVYLISKEVPILYRGERFTATLKVSSEGWVDVKNLKEVKLSLSALFHGDIDIINSGNGTNKPREGIPVELDVRFESDRPIRVSMPEGYVYANVAGWVSGKAEDPYYSIRVEFLSGELKYFGRRFFLREGTLTVTRSKDVEEKLIDVTLFNPSDGLNIFLNLRGELEDPKLLVWSEPPRSTQELLTKLVIGSTAEGVLPVAKALFRELGYIGSIRSGLANLLGVDITFSTQTGPQGDVGFNVNVRKKIAKAFSVEYQQSTLKDPKATYYGAGLSLPRGFDLYGRLFSDKSTEIKLRFIRKFDF